MQRDAAEKPVLMNRSAESDSDRIAEGHPPARILQIGNYPPPVCGWAMQTKLLVEEIHRRGNVCQVLNLNDSRRSLCAKLISVTEGYDQVKKQAQLQVAEDNIARTVDWLLGAPASEGEELRRDWVHVA